MTRMIRLRAEAMQMYKGKNLLRGALFSAPADEADSLVALHFATVVDEPVVAAAVQEYTTKQETAFPPHFKPVLRRRTAVQTEESEPGHYSRRDLRAEN